jgi:hypothetical protein
MPARLSIVIIFLITACKFSEQETIILREITVYDSLEKDRQIAKDLSGYDYRTLLRSQGITDEGILKNISWQYFVRSTDQKVDFRLILKDNALSKEKQITRVFNSFLDDKLQAYTERSDELDSAVEKAHHFINLMNREDEEQIWKAGSASLLVYVTKPALSKTLHERLEWVKKTKGLPQLHSRQLHDNLDGIRSDFIVVFF